MRASFTLSRSAVLAFAFASAGSFSLAAQTFAANTGTDAVVTAMPDASDPKVAMPGAHRGADDNLIFGRIRNGVYTVDGMVAKVKLNYDVNGVRHLYLFVPGLGTAVVSAVANKDAMTTEAVLKGNDLHFVAGDHRFTLTGVALASNKGKAPEHLYVTLDRTAWHLTKQPMVGFGNAGALPYEWPGALGTADMAAKADAENPAAPPVPVSLLPSTKSTVPSSSFVSPSPVQPATLQPVSMP